MRQIKQLTDNKFLNIKEVVDPEHHVKGYQFAERRGVDSIAFICYDSYTNKFLLNNEYKPPVNEMILGAFGGSLDKDVNKMDIVIGEVREEAGFEVTEDDIVELGKVFVSTQMNQYCYLYLVYVFKSEQKDRQPENAVEALANTVWVANDLNIFNGIEDWKVLGIVAKSQNQGLIK